MCKQVAIGLSMEMKEVTSWQPFPRGIAGVLRLSLADTVTLLLWCRMDNLTRYSMHALGVLPAWGHQTDAVACRRQRWIP